MDTLYIYIIGAIKKFRQFEYENFLGINEKLKNLKGGAAPKNLMCWISNDPQFLDGTK